jgi:hypothetical protein
MTAISIAVLLAILAFFVLIALTLTPIYIENFNVNSHLTRLGKESGVTTMTKEEIRSTLMKRFEIDDVKNVQPEDIGILDDKGLLTINVEYEVRRHILGNVDVVVYFNELVEVHK